MTTRLRRVVAGLAGAALVTPVLGGCGLLDNGAYDLPLPGGADVGTDPTSMDIHFRDVEGLVPKSNVKMDNVAVGTVRSISIDEKTWTAVVEADVRNDLDLPADVEARVRRSSLLGEWYVELVRPEASTAAGTPVAASSDPTDIPIERTGGTAAVEDVLGALSLLLNNGGLPQLNTITTELNKALQGNEPEVRALLSDLTEFTTRLDERRDDIVAALDGLGRLSRTLRDNKDQIALALDALPEGLKVLADERPQLVRMLRSLDRLSDVTVRVVDQSQADTVADLEQLRPILRSLAQAGQDLPDALQILATFPFTPGALEAVQGDYVNLDAKVDLDLGAVLQSLSLPSPTILGSTGGTSSGPGSVPLLDDPLSLLDDPLTIIGNAGSLLPKDKNATGTTSSDAGQGLMDLLGGLLGAGS